MVVYGSTLYYGQLQDGRVWQYYTCHVLLMTFANRNWYTNVIPERTFWKKLRFEKKTQKTSKYHEKIPQHAKKYSKTCIKRPLSKRPKIGFQDQLSLNAGQKYCRMLQGEHSAIHSTFI